MTKTTADCNEDGAGLLPCPFCGAGPLCSSSKVDAEPVAICFECPNGCSVSKEAPTYDGAVSIWNTRATPPQNCGQVEGVREALAEVAKISEDPITLTARMRLQEICAGALAALRSIEPPGGEVRSNPLRDALLRGFLSTTTCGDKHQLQIIFQTLEEMQEARKALYHAIRERPADALLALDSNDGAQREVDGDEKLRLFLSILQSAGGQTSGSDDPWNWINHFCDDAEPLDTFNQASKRKLTRVTHDSDSDVSWVYLTDAGKAFIATPALSVSVRSGWQPIDDKARDGREVLLRRDVDGAVFAGYYGLAPLAHGAGASTNYPWTILDNTNGVNHIADGGKIGVTHYRALSSEASS